MAQYPICIKCFSPRIKEIFYLINPMQHYKCQDCGHHWYSAFDEFNSNPTPTWIRSKKQIEYCITCDSELKQHQSTTVEKELKSGFRSKQVFNSIYFDHYECINPTCPDFAEENTASGFRFSLGVPEVKEIKIRKTHADSIVELTFVLRPIKGWFAEHAKPMIDVIKGTVPVTHRTYNADAKKWEIAIEFWPGIETTIKALGWTIVVEKEVETPKVKVPKDFEENFYHSNAPITTIESKESIHSQLTKLLGDNFTKTEYRQYARKHHPDLGGDASKMAEINRLWAMYNTN